MDKSSKLNIVVVGAGAAGSSTARHLSAKLDASKYNLILIDSRPYRILLPATARMTVSDTDHLEDTAFVNIDEKLFFNGNGKFLVGTVKSIEKDGAVGGRVVLHSGEAISYHVLVLAPGALWEGALAFPNDPEEVKAFLKTSREHFRTAQKIVLVGGGAVGAEIAGEIKDVWPEKKVTIVQGDHQLLNKTYPDKFRKALGQSISSRGVDIVYNDYVDTIPEPGASVVTRNGKTIEADLVLQTRGPRPNTGFIASLGGDVLTEQGLVKIKPTLQLQNHAEIFAGGDVIDWPEQKQAAKAGNHAKLLAANILSYLDNRPLKNYAGSAELIVVTNGKNGGVAYFGVLWGITLGAWFARMVKSKTLMVDLMRKDIGYQ